MNETFFSTGRVDRWVARRLQRPINWWCKQTGRNNFTLARATAKIVPLLVAMSSLVSQHKDAFDIGIGTFATGVWIVITVNTLQNYKVLEAMAARLVDGQASISLQEAKAIQATCVRRICDGVAGIFILGVAIIPPVTIGLMLIASAFLTISFSGYAAMSFNPGGKSAWARAKDRLGAWADRVSERLSPAPVPIPVRVRCS